MFKRILKSVSIILFMGYFATDVFAEETSISANPAAVNILTGSGELQRNLEKRLGIQNNHGLRIGGMWLGDVNDLFSGGIPDRKQYTSNSLFILSAALDTEKFCGWKGGLFSIEFLQLNAQATNVQAGSVQGYNSIPGPPPLNRTELYQFWYRQELFNKKFIIRVGKTVPTFDFGNVIKPVAISNKEISIPAVSGLIFTPLFINPTMLSVLPGYYNSAYGVTLSFIPTKEWYVSYGIYDGSGAQSIQTGNRAAPTFNGTYFNIAETGFSWLLGKNKLPGNFGIGAWHQSGLIQNFLNIPENGASGYYLFGTQRLWYRQPGIDNSGVSGFYQFGLNNASALFIKKYVGAGLTAFDMIPGRKADSFGAGVALSWLNRLAFTRPTELMYQAYYQAKVFNGVYLEPVVSYIPTPGASSTLGASWAGTLRAIVLF